MELFFNLKPMFVASLTVLLYNVSSKFFIGSFNPFFDTPLHNIFCFPFSSSIIYNFEHKKIIFSPKNSSLKSPVFLLSNALQE